MRLNSCFGVLALAFAVGAAAQPVYRCEFGGKVQYSHEQCLGAKVVDTTPTQGLDKSTGASRKGQDVQRAEMNKAMADAMKPLLNETPEERERRHRRAKLSAAGQGECSALDSSVQGARSEHELFSIRKRYRDLASRTPLFR